MKRIKGEEETRGTAKKDRDTEYRDDKEEDGEDSVWKGNAIEKRDDAKYERTEVGKSQITQ